ncbi:putative reactive intermediate deaminase TdcF [compost metagenome]
MRRIPIHSDQAPAAIGTYSQAVRMGSLVFLTGQIPLNPVTMELAEGIEAQAVQVFENLKAVAAAAGGSFADVAKLNIYLTDLNKFAVVNDALGRYFDEPYPARATVGVASLAKGALIAVDATMVME